MGTTKNYSEFIMRHCGALSHMFSGNLIIDQPKVAVLTLVSKYVKHTCPVNRSIYLFDVTCTSSDDRTGGYRLKLQVKKKSISTVLKEEIL